MITSKVWLGLFVLAFIGYIVGLINPRWVIWWGRRRTRSRALIVYGAFMLVFATLFMITGPFAARQAPINFPVETYIDEEMTLQAEKAREAVNALLSQNKYAPLTPLFSDEGYTVYAAEELGLYLSIYREPGSIQIEWNTVGLETTSSRDEKLADLAFEVFTREFLANRQVQDLMRILREVCREADKPLAESPSGEIQIGQAERRVPYGRILAAVFCRKTWPLDHKAKETVEKSIQLAKFRPLTEP